MPEQNTKAIPVRTVRIPDVDWEWAGKKAHDLPDGRKTAGRVVRAALTKFQKTDPLSPNAANKAPIVESSKTGGGETQPPQAPPSPDSRDIPVSGGDVSFSVPMT